jgi:hypothetical protein
MSSIRESLGSLSVLKKASLKVELKLEKTRSRRMSQALTDRDVDLSLAESSDLDSQEKFPSLFKDQFEVAEKIGEGAHGIVRKCVCRGSGEVRAVKTFRLEGEHIAFLKKNFKDVKQLQHAHVIAYRALFFEMQTDTCHLVMDHFPFPDLLAHPQFSELVLLPLLSGSSVPFTRFCRHSGSPTSRRSATAILNLKTYSTTPFSSMRC